MLKLFIVVAGCWAFGPKWFAVVLAWWLARRFRNAWRAVRQERDAAELPPACMAALCLAYPSVRGPEGYFEQDSIIDGDAFERSVRNALLHNLELHSGMSPDEIRALLPHRLRQAWFRVALATPSGHADPRDAMAFACARVAHAVRLAGLLGWIDAETQWQVLSRNAARAADCFEGWADFGRAWARGRKQWIADARADSLGQPFDEAQVEAWIADPSHPWSWIPWEQLRDPVAVATTSSSTGTA